MQVAQQPEAKAGVDQQESVVLHLENLPRYLLDRQLISAVEVVDGRLMVEDRSRRNRNFKILSPERQNLLVKQGRFSDEQGNTVRTEALVLHAIHHHSAFEATRWFTPPLIYYDFENNILVSELVHPATSLTKFHLNLGQVHFPVEAARTVAHQLAHFHAGGEAAIAAGGMDFLKPGAPWVFSDQTLLDDTGVRGSYVKMIKAKGIFARQPAELKTWLAEGKGIVHADIRWDNFVLTHGAGKGGNMNFRLIDFELAHVGDSAYDLASYLAEYVRFMFMTTFGHEIDGIEALKAKSLFQPEDAHESIRMFVGAYCRRRGFGKAQSAELLERVRAYLPYAILVVGLESLQRQTRVTGVAKTALEISDLVSREPVDTIKEWFGL